MFGTSPKPAPASATPSSPTYYSNGNGNGNGHVAPNRLSSDVSIKGDVSFSSELVIDGRVEGNIVSDGKLTVGEHGKVIGDIQVGSVTVQGEVRGDILASDRCALQRGGSLHGDIEAPRFAVDESASFIGNAKISSNGRG